jgi:hypothetical protein
MFLGSEILFDVSLPKITALVAFLCFSRSCLFRFLLLRSDNLFLQLTFDCNLNKSVLDLCIHLRLDDFLHFSELASQL